MAAIRNNKINAIKYKQINSMWRIITAHNWEVSVRNRDIRNFPNQGWPLRCTADVPAITFIDFFLRKLLPGRLHLSLVVLTHFLTDNWCQPRGRAVASRLLARAATNPTNRSVVQFTTTRKGVSGG